MALSGTEVVQVLGATGNGQPAATTENATTAQIAALGVMNRGTVTLTGATPVSVTYAGTVLSGAGSLITFSLKTVGGTVGAYPTIQTITAGTGFTVAGTAGDTSTYNWIAE